MASKRSVGVELSKSPYDYQCEEDVRTLTRAAEVLADRGRASMAMKKFKRMQTGADKLFGAFSGRRAHSRYR